MMLIWTMSCSVMTLNVFFQVHISLTVVACWLILWPHNKKVLGSIPFLCGDWMILRTRFLPHSKWHSNFLLICTVRSCTTSWKAVNWVGNVIFVFRELWYCWSVSYWALCMKLCWIWMGLSIIKVQLTWSKNGFVSGLYSFLFLHFNLIINCSPKQFLNIKRLTFRNLSSTKISDQKIITVKN